MSLAARRVLQGAGFVLLLAILALVLAWAEDAVRHLGNAP